MLVFLQKILNFTIRNLLKFIIFPIVRIIWIQKINGLNNINRSGPLILASNHNSYFDFICLSAISPRPIHFFAGEIFFKKAFWKNIMIATDQIEIDRYGVYKKQSAKNALDQALIFLKSGQIVGIYPEGTRSSNGKLGKPFNGVSLLALKSKAPVIPIGMVGTFEIMSRHDKWPHLKKCVINIGKPILPQNDNLEINNEEDAENLTKLIMDEIGKLSLQNIEKI